MILDHYSPPASPYQDSSPSETDPLELEVEVMQLRSQVDDQTKIIGRLQEAQVLLVNEMAKVKEVLASLQQTSQSRSSSLPPVSASHSTSQILSPNSTTSSLLSPNSTTSSLLSPNSTTSLLLSPNSTSPPPGQLQ